MTAKLEKFYQELISLDAKGREQIRQQMLTIIKKRQAREKQEQN